MRYGRAVRRGLLSSRAGVGTALKKDRTRPGQVAVLQGASILAVTSVGQAGGALLAGGILTNLTVLVPMPGLWGMAGWWWYVPATVAYPFLVPMLVTMGMASLVPLEILRRNRKRWKGITDGLNHEFWTITSEDVREEYFGMMATAEREAEMRTFLGVREGDANATDDARYYTCPWGGRRAGRTKMTTARTRRPRPWRCRGWRRAARIWGSAKGGGGGACGSFVGSFRRRESGNVRPDDSPTETEKFQTANLS